MDGRRRKTVHAARRPEERPKDASHSSTFTECTAAMLTLPSFAGPTSARSVTRTVRMRFSVGTSVEMIRQLKITRDTAMKARTTAMNTLKQIIVQAPPVLREALHDLTDPRPAHALHRTPTGPHRHAHRVRQAHPPVARPSVDGSRRGKSHCTTAPRASHHRDITDPLRGLRGGRPHRG